MDSLAHPIGTSHYADGEIPDQRNPRASVSDEKAYAQPMVEVQEVARGAEINDDRKKSLCQRIAEEKADFGIGEWFQRNKGTLAGIGITYLVLRIVIRST